jgi:large subunit ribosomal protein L30
MSEKKTDKIVAVRVRGLMNIRGSISDTMNLLMLFRKNFCVVLDDTPSVKGMLFKVKDYITWGVIDDDTLKLLIEKRGKKDQKFFRLNPPRKGFGRKGIKTPFSIGGALGDRRDKINDLVKRMI